MFTKFSFADFRFRHLACCAVVAVTIAGCGGDNTASTTAQPAASATLATTPPPVIHSTPPTSVEVGSKYQYIPSASDPDERPLSYDITNKPDWATFAATTGELSGTPHANDAGTTAEIEIGVSDGTSRATVGPFRIRIVPAGPHLGGPKHHPGPPTISGTPAATVLAPTLTISTPSLPNGGSDALATLQGIYANSTILLASNYGIAPGNSATVNDTGFAALKAAMAASPNTIWHVIFASGAYTYTNNRWLWGIQNVIIDAYGASFQCTSSSDGNAGNQIPLYVNDPFDDSGDTPWPHTTYVNGDLINTVASGAASVTTTTAGNAAHYSAGMPVLLYGYDQQGWGYPPNPRYFEYKTVLSANASTGVVTFTDFLQNFYDSRWWDTLYGDGTQLYHGAPRILSLQRANYTQANLIWIKGATFLGNSVTPGSNQLQVTANLMIYEDVSAAAFNVVLTNRAIIKRGHFVGNLSTGDKVIGSLVIEDSVLDPNPGDTNGAGFADCVGCNSLSLIRTKIYGNIYEIAPRNLIVNDSDIIPLPGGANTYSGITTAGNNPIWSVSVANTRIYNTGGTFSYGVSNKASPGNALTVGSVSGTNIQIAWGSTAETVAYAIDYGMTLTNTVTGNTGTVTGIYYSSASGGVLVITGTWSTPAPGDVFYSYDVMRASDGGGNFIIGAQVPFWRAPPVPASTL
jgi:hypothetical protein